MLDDKIKTFLFSILTIGFITYSIFLYSFLPVINSEVSNDCYKGKTLWQKHNCIACHQIYGLGGYLGPDLTNEYSLKGSVYIYAFLKSGNNVMPNFKLTDKEINELTSFLQNVDSSGKSDPRSYKTNLDGTIKQY